MQSTGHKRYLNATHPARLAPVQFQRHWKIKNKNALCKALGIRKISDTPTREKLLEVWSTDTYEACAGMFLPVPIPLTVDPWEHETVSLPVEFLKNILAPACVAHGC